MTYPVENYADLKEAVQDYMNSTESRMVAAIPSFINSTMRALFNNPKFRINPFRDTLELTILADGTALKPSDYLEAAHLYSTIDGSWANSLSILPYDSIRNSATIGGYPQYYASNGDSFLIYPSGDDSKLELDYYYSPPTLGSSANVSASNYVLTSGGTGYSVDDVVTVTPTSGEAASWKVTAVNAGVITTLIGVESGSNFVKGTTYPLVGGAGSGSQITIPSVDEETNWLIVNEPNLLIYGACHEAATYADDGEQAIKWQVKFENETQRIIDRQTADTFSGGTMVMSNGRGSPNLGYNPRNWR